MKIILEGLYKNTLFKDFINDYGVSFDLFHKPFFYIYVIHFDFIYRIPRA
jgi:hypothetical protein